LFAEIIEDEITSRVAIFKTVDILNKYAILWLLCMGLKIWHFSKYITTT